MTPNSNDIRIQPLGSGSMRVVLEPLDSEHIDQICMLLNLPQETVQGYLAEEVFGWSMSRVVLAEAGVSGGELTETGVSGGELAKTGAAKPSTFSTTGRIVGLIQAAKLDQQKGLAVLGTWLVPDVWGTGINAEAKEKLLLELFATFPAITRVYLCIDTSNFRSIRAARKLPYADEISESDVPEQLVSELASSSSSELHCWFVIRQETYQAALS